MDFYELKDEQSGKNISCGYSKELSHRDGSFKHTKNIFKLMGKKKKILCIKSLLFWTYKQCKMIRFLCPNV